MDYYDLTDEQKAETGIDYDFGACLQYNPQPFIIENVKKVLAIIEGDNDGPDWHWVVALRGEGNVFVYMRGGCDYTGWDCQSWAETVYLSPTFGLLDGIKKLSNNYDSLNPLAIYQALQAQLLTQQKKKTWREENDKIFKIKGAN